MVIVIKRDGTEVPFDRTKIENAINKAFMEVDGQLYETDTAKDIATEMEDFIFEECNDRIPKISIEQIERFVERELQHSERPDVAQAYINYRIKRSRIRNRNSNLMKEYSNKLKGKNIVNQNANVDEMSFGGRKGEAGDVVSKRIALDDYVSGMALKNHEENMIYIHDLSDYAVGMHNCLSVPFDHLLKDGFNTRQTDVRPAGSVNTAMQLVAVIFQLQSLQQFGGVSATHLDWTMVPYVRKSFYKHYKDGLKYISRLSDEEIERETHLEVDPGEVPIHDDYVYAYIEAEEYARDMTKKEIHQAVEGLYHNLK